jgi:hypothetical protein
MKIACLAPRLVLNFPRLYGPSIFSRYVPSTGLLARAPYLVLAGITTCFFPTARYRLPRDLSAIGYENKHYRQHRSTPQQQKQSVKQGNFFIGDFTTFYSDRCRWRIAHGQETSDCTLDEYGQRRRRGWVNLQCNPTLKGRAALVAVSEPAKCEFELTVQSPEVCPPLPPTKCNESSLSGATAYRYDPQPTASIRYMTWTVEFLKVRALGPPLACRISHLIARALGHGK